MTLYSPQFVLNFASGSASFSLSPQAALQLRQALGTLLERFQLHPGRPRQQPQPPVEFRHSAQELNLEVFCNPNIWPGPHAAKVLVTLKTPLLRLSTEVDLSRLQEDLNQYLESV
ncbi:MAG: hypothetical protein Q6K80_09555 [Thermostichus sp. DG_1_6_bins_120]